MPEPMDHVAYLSQEIGPRPAGTEEEQQTALYITEQMQKDAGLSAVMLVAAGVYLCETVFSRIWLHYCLFGPLEWIWRMLTYGKWLPLFK